MKRLFKELAKVILMVILGLPALFWVFSFHWSYEDMSTLEKTIAIIYFAAMIPLYYGIKWAVKKIFRVK